MSIHATEPLSEAQRLHARWNAEKCWEMAEELAKDTDHYRSVYPEFSTICKRLTVAYIHAAADFEKILTEQPDAKPGEAEKVSQMFEAIEDLQ